ncbi:MAG: FMN-binding glutamate synthase family protein [Chiayiivirga sp.]|jgi:glutamate synthase domain-containing protein 2|uniref:FMN-binding glutamate synthase family protein n=1 Tax=Chiayiivirga sp. TaxID=2041042 RepID=UPI0025C42FE9|nr:FMN-binding glutamate synthase family protein [Chiayiivirga sp.]MCI1730036.1 FMN-binding glutamate synthase family protein [Chiayiivirga sp.]
MLPSRYLVFVACLLLAVFSALAVWKFGPVWCWPLALFGALAALGVHDLVQVRRSVLRNYPVMAHFRFLFESIRPEIRQYFLEDDNEETPFSRVQRSIIYQRAKNALDKRPFGTQLDVYQPQYEWINHSMLPREIESHDFRVNIGGPACAKPYSASVFNISAMSFGALSANAIMALNEGARRGGFYHDTGEGSISRYHREHGGDLVWEIGSGYFGCRNDDGSFNAERFRENAASDQVRMIEIKLSQGAKPGHGGVLPGAKVSGEIARARGVPEGQDCISPARHSAFSTPRGLLEFVAQLRELSGGKPVGFKLAIGHPWEWFAIAKAMVKTGIQPDFIVVDGGEGGTGAAPLEFTNHVGAPLREALLLVHNTLVGLNMRGSIRIGAAGKIVTAFDLARTIAIGADWCNAARGFMFALGCIQSQSCHTSQCPTGVATQDPLRQRALVVPDKAERVHLFHKNTLKALKELLAAAGLTHPDQLGPEHVIRRVSSTEVRSLAALHHFVKAGELLGDTPEHPVFKIFWPQADPESFEAPPSLLSLQTSKQR